ncbi:unnamed protein product [Kuraishia capsulata CBS 1993]|uniref:Uncharacterized protein n=1 Tax=Kuraishia capsulata CBS 1993 TaxID=1382522 RepID=W6MJV4_9ASCO|nr:uncharacterized protein KUCA_T00000784001 [Kuraishia capsulata CBS 1993]CDK24817.1 unnamed protein product [Kuraishia capsulata CBS 1993]
MPLRVVEGTFTVRHRGDHSHSGPNRNAAVAVRAAVFWTTWNGVVVEKLIPSFFWSANFLPDMTEKARISCRLRPKGQLLITRVDTQENNVKSSNAWTNVCSANKASGISESQDDDIQITSVRVIEKSADSGTSELSSVTSPTFKPGVLLSMASQQGSTQAKKPKSLRKPRSPPVNLFKFQRDETKALDSEKDNFEEKVSLFKNSILGTKREAASTETHANGLNLATGNYSGNLPHQVQQGSIFNDVSATRIEMQALHANFENMCKDVRILNTKLESLKEAPCADYLIRENQVLKQQLNDISGRLSEKSLKTVRLQKQVEELRSRNEASIAKSLENQTKQLQTLLENYASLKGNAEQTPVELLKEILQLVKVTSDDSTLHLKQLKKDSYMSSSQIIQELRSQSSRQSVTSKLMKDQFQKLIGLQGKPDCPNDASLNAATQTYVDHEPDLNLSSNVKIKVEDFLEGQQPVDEAQRKKKLRCHASPKSKKLFKVSDD